MIVSFDDIRGLIRIEGMDDLYPSRSLIASASGDMVSISRYDGAFRIFGPDHYSTVQRADGTMFASVSEAMTYLTTLFSKEKTYQMMEWVSPSASTEWTIVHNLGYFPRVTVIDTAGQQIMPDVTNIDLSSLTINFAFPVNGIAYLN